MRLIDADKLEIVMFGMNGDGVTEDEIERAPTVNAVVIPDNATNLDVFLAIFKGTPDTCTCPVFCISRDDVKCQCDANTCRDGDWWNIPYKKGGTE